jgi:hypothetical protein
MPAIVFYLLALVVMCVEGALLAAVGWTGIALHTPVVIVVVLGLEREFRSAGVLVALLVVPVEWFVVGVPGVYSLALVITFFLMSGLRGQVQASWGLARAVVAAMASLLHSVVVLVLLLVMGLGAIAPAVAWNILPSMFVVAVMTIGLGRMWGAADRMMDPRRGRQRLEFS